MAEKSGTLSPAPTIDQAKHSLRELEQKVCTALQEFENHTGLVVADMQIARQESQALGVQIPPKISSVRAVARLL